MSEIRTVLLIDCDNSSLVIDKLIEAEAEDTAIIFFYFEFAARNEQSPVNVLGSLLRQLVGGLGEVPEVVVQEFRKQRRGTRARGLRTSGILKMFQAATTKRTFICVDALDECVPEHRMEILGSLKHILQKSPNTRLFMTGRPYVRSEVKRKLDGKATFILIRPTEDGILRYLRNKFKNDTIPEMMSSTLRAEVMKLILEMSLETYVKTSAGKKGYPRRMADIFESRFLPASLYIKEILRGTTLADRRTALESINNGAELGEAYNVTLERIKAQDRGMANLAMATLT